MNYKKLTPITFMGKPDESLSRNEMLYALRVAAIMIKRQEQRHLADWERLTKKVLKGVEEHRKLMLLTDPLTYFRFPGFADGDGKPGGKTE